MTRMNVFDRVLLFTVGHTFKMVPEGNRNKIKACMFKISHTPIV